MDSQSEIDFKGIFDSIWKGKWLISSIVSVISVVALVFALSLPDIYKSDILLSPASDDDGLRVPGQLGGLAALAGVNLGGGNDRSGVAMEVLKSRDFVGRFIAKYDLLVPIVAANGWDKKSNVVKIDSSLYDKDSGKWVRTKDGVEGAIPSLVEAHELFTKDILSVSQNKKTGLVTVSVSFYSPEVAAKWASDLVNELNREIRERDLNDAQKSIEYLNKQLAETSISEMRNMLFVLIEEQTKKAMIANVKDEYVFKVIDPPVLAEKESAPNRVLILILSVFLSLSLGVFVAYLKFYPADK